jgi:hypothetical protein
VFLTVHRTLAALHRQRSHAPCGVSDSGTFGNKAAEMLLHAHGVGREAGEVFEGAHGLTHSHGAAIDHAASASAGGGE